MTDAIRSRFPWLLLNLLAVFLVAAVIELFESTIAQVVFLAAFLPIIAGPGGVGGIQTVTLVVRNLATGGIPKRYGAHLLRREVLVGMFHGLLLGVIVGGAGLLWQGSPVLSLVLAIAITGNMLVASVAGSVRRW